MEKCVEKAKITLPRLGRNSASGKWKLLVTIATVAQVMALFTPWLWQKYSFIIEYTHSNYQIVPIGSLPKEAWFWPFMIAVRTTTGEWKVLLLGNYWFNSNIAGSVWLFLCMLQILTIAAAYFIVRKGGSNKRIASVVLSFMSSGAPILCIHQIATLSFFGYAQSGLFVGFWLAVSSSFLFIASVWLE
jgi:hypothetical protein